MNAFDFILNTEEHGHHSSDWRNYKRKWIFSMKKRIVSQIAASPWMCRGILAKAKAMKRIVPDDAHEKEWLFFPPSPLLIQVDILAEMR